jgi:hypothetical protein
VRPAATRNKNQQETKVLQEQQQHLLEDCTEVSHERVLSRGAGEAAGKRSVDSITSKETEVEPRKKMKSYVYFLVFGLITGSLGDVNNIESDVETIDNRPGVFKAYDCTKPINIKDLGFVGESNCANHAKVDKTRTVQYQVLQKEKHIRSEGQSCSMTKTRLSRYCGTYGHQTLLSEASLFDVSVAVSVEQCRTWQTSLSYTDEHGQAHKLTADSINTVAYEEIGRTYIEHGEVDCIGQDWRWNGQILHRMVVEVQLKITLSKETFLLNSKEVIAHLHERKLPCTPATNGCQTPLTTYLWEAVDLDCSLSVTRISKGTEITSNTGDKVFASTDGSLMRLIKKEAVSLCGRVVYTTNYDSIFLYDANKTDLFTRQISPGEVSQATFIKNRDDFLYNNVLNKIEDELRGVLVSDCQHRSQREKRDFWSQHRDPGLTTWLVGDGIFATTAGEVVYHYQCAPVMVQAVNLGRCYQALPVKILDVRSDEVGEPPRQWFVEPLTRRLTHHGVEVPCSSLFRAKYANAGGSWTFATPEIIAAPTPTLAKDPEDSREIFQDRPDFSKGGIYTEETMAAFEDYQDFSRTIMAMGATLVNQAGPEWQYRTGQFLSPEQLFPELKDPTQWAQKMWSTTRKFLHTWGECASIILSLYTASRLLSGLFEWLYSVAVLKEVVGWSRNLAWTLCPNLFMLRQYRQYNRQRPDDQDGDQGAVVVATAPSEAEIRKKKPGWCGRPNYRVIEPVGHEDDVREEAHEGLSGARPTGDPVYRGNGRWSLDGEGARQDSNLVRALETMAKDAKGLRPKYDIPERLHVYKE